MQANVKMQIVVPMEIFSLDGDKIVTDHEDECTLCEVCVDMCPNDCITIKDE